MQQLHSAETRCQLHQHIQPVSNRTQLSRISPFSSCLMVRSSPSDILVLLLHMCVDAAQLGNA
eukprot:280333-Chlamydomonas_euryale.AAC.1